nr:sporulation histidine kinase inhibitor Sda [Salipaludibacillus daqingensis]
MRDLSDELLMETFVKAKDLNLADDFVNLIAEELDRRAIYRKKIHL